MTVKKARVSPIERNFIIRIFQKKMESYLLVYLVRVKAPIHLPTQSCDTISWCGKPVERTIENSSLNHVIGPPHWFPKQLIRWQD